MFQKSIYAADNPPFVDIHTHRREMSAGVLSVTNFTQEDLKNGLYTEGSAWASLGLHPWFLTRENFNNDFQKLSQLVHNQDVVAIGECGLDKLKGEDLAFQTLAFDAQIRLAESARKPVVVHCVRAFGEVIAAKKRLKPTVPIIIHGFNKKGTVLAELLRHGFFISIGTAVLPKNRADTEGSYFSEIIRKVPLDRLFFETDVVDDINISEMYEAASGILKMDIMCLKSIIYESFIALAV